MNDPLNARPQTISLRLLWFSRVMGWACCLGIALTTAFALLRAIGVIPGSNTPADPGSLIAYSSVAVEAAAPDATIPSELQHDPLYIIARLVPALLTIWALLSARRVFANIGKGAFFIRSTSLGLRNLSLAVLLGMTLAPLITMAAHIAFGLRMQAQGVHGEINLEFGLSDTTLLVMIFAGMVAIIASIMAHAARVAEENEQFV